MNTICGKIYKFIKILVKCLIFLVVAGIPFYLLFVYKADATAWITYYLALVTGGIIWWQGGLLKRQLELQTITDLYKEWNEKLVEARKNYWKKEDDLDAIEEVLEYLEKIASYYRQGVLSRDLIWDTFSWYILRYYFYSKDKISKIQKRWGNDKTLYTDLECLYRDLIEMEAHKRKISENEIENQFSVQKDKFKSSESQNEQRN